MVELRPLCAVRYDPERAGVQMRCLIAPPYDVVGPADHAALLAACPYNVVRLELPLDRPGGSPEYAAAGRLWRDWLARGILRRDERPALYVHDHEFTLEAGSADGGRTARRLTRRGVLGAVRLEPWEAGAVLPHERTLARPKQDRLNLMHAIPANLSPVFALYRDPEGRARGVLGAITARPPDQDFVAPNGDRHRLWVETDPARIAAFAEALHDQPVFIADGHHRYETALAYREERRRAEPHADPAAPHNFILMSLTDVDDPGLAILPIHRVLRQAPCSAAEALARLEPGFTSEAVVLDAVDAAGSGTVAGPPGAALARLAEAGRDGPALLLVVPPGDRALLLRPRDGGRGGAGAAGPRPLDATIARVAVIEGAFGVDEAALEAAVWFTRDAAEAVEAVRRGEAVAAILLNPVDVDQMVAEALAGRRLPQKSTFFYPKVPTGLAIHSLDPSEG